MNQCDGQMSLMDFIMPIVPQNEPPILLSEGDTVYKVIRGDIETCVVTCDTWNCGGGDRGYRLNRINGFHDCAWNTQINKVIFANLEDARRVAEQYLSKNEHILAQDIHYTKVVAYKYQYRGREITEHYSILENGNVYFHYGGMYEHIGKEKEIKDFEIVRNNHVDSNGYAELRDYQPEYANMYKCTKGDKKWLYAAARYEFIG